MLQVDILSAYLICGVGSLVGAAMLRVAETDDRRLRDAIRVCGGGLIALGVGLLPAGLGAGAGHPVAQWSLTAGSLAALAILAQGLGLLQGRGLSSGWVAVLVGLSLVTMGLAATQEAHLHGKVYAVGLAGMATLMAAQARGFVVSPRDLTERALGAALSLVAASSWLRAAFTLSYDGPPLLHLLYVPEAFLPAFAALYGVMPMVVATLLLSLVNTRLGRQLRSLALTDELTGTMTRRALRELAPALIGLERMRQRQVAVLMLDLDHFKRINDTYGHHIGDAVLQRAARALQAHMRGDTLLARYGGEEFVAVVPVDDLPAARRVAERLRETIAGADWAGAAQVTGGVTVSVGVALVGPGETLEDVLRRADEALYRAKREGRNRCQVGLMVA